MNDLVVGTLVLLLGLDCILGSMLAINAFGSSDWIARSYAHLPRALRLPGQDQPRYYRIVGLVMVMVAIPIFALLVIRLSTR